METLVFTPAAILELLASIEEIKDLPVGVSETPDGDIQIQVGESNYIIKEPETKNTVKVEEEVVDKVDEINEQAYQDIEDKFEDAVEKEVIETGLVKALGKVLLIGGLVKLLK